MAAIGEIRKRSWLLVVVIVIGMLAFILGDMINNRGGSVEQSAVATVNGQEITSADYQAEVEKEFGKTDLVYQMLTRQPAPSSERQRISDEYMGRYLNKLMFQAEYDKLGLKVAQDEYNDLIQGNNVNGQIYEQYGLFVGPDRKFSADSMRKNLPLYLQQDGFQNFLEVVGDQAEVSRLQQKYFNMITKGMYVTSYEAKKDFLANNSAANFSYVYVPFESVSEEEVTISDSDLKAYYNKHKSEKKYEQEDKVSFNYIEFLIEPSTQDKKVAKDYLVSRKELFEQAEDDSTFILQNSDSRNLDFTTGNFPSDIDSIVNNAQIGDVIGPYVEGEYYKLAKVIDNSTKPQAEVRHILLGSNIHTDPVAQQKLADSITKVLKKDRSKFEEMVTKFSTDQGSVINGGKYEWFDKGRMVAEFEEVSFNKPVNSINQAKTQYGIHIVEVLGKREKKELKVATVDSEMRRSRATINEARDEAIAFISSFSSTDGLSDSAFRNAATRAGLSISPANDITVQQDMPQFDGNFMQIKKWAFSKNTDEGDISDDFVFDKKIVVAQLTSRSKKGVPAFDELSSNTLSDIRYAVLNEKRGQKLAEKMKGSSIEEIAKANNLEVKTEPNGLLANPNVEGRMEPAVVGAAFGLAQNSTSSAIIGKTGVYVIKLNSVTEATLPENFDQQKDAARSQLRGTASDRAFQALIKVSNLEDNRDKVNVLGN